LKNEQLLEAAKRMRSQIVEWRRDFHQHPELGYEEYRTAGIVAEHLRGLGLEVSAGVGRTGVVGLLRGEAPGPTFLLRADMDALPIPEAEKGVPYGSKLEGKAHLCGHDAHTSMLMAAAQMLAERGLPRGNIKFMFQPAEEGLAGAKAMIDDGVLEQPRVDAAAALHVSPLYPTGRLAVARGVGWAASNGIRIRIIGKGGHAAGPHLTIESIPVAAQVVIALQQIASRQVDPLDSVVVTIGQISGGYARNVIAPEVELLGTVRTLNPELRRHMKDKLETIIKGVTQALGASYEMEFSDGYPVVTNDDGMVDLFERVCDATMGSGQWETIKPSMGAEDFAFVAERVLSVMFRLGTRNGERTCITLPSILTKTLYHSALRCWLRSPWAIWNRAADCMSGCRLLWLEYQMKRLQFGRIQDDKVGIENGLGRDGYYARQAGGDRRQFRVARLRRCGRPAERHRMGRGVGRGAGDFRQLRSCSGFRRIARSGPFAAFRAGGGNRPDEAGHSCHAYAYSPRNSCVPRAL
jgi:amidohydrolase